MVEQSGPNINKDKDKKPHEKNDVRNTKDYVRGGCKRSATKLAVVMDWLREGKAVAVPVSVMTCNVANAITNSKENGNNDGSDNNYVSREEGGNVKTMEKSVIVTKN